MVSFGDRNTAVSALQFELQKLGYYPAALDGEFGELTQSAVRAIQKEFGLESDGIVGPVTRRMLDSLRGHWDTGPNHNPPIREDLRE
ncbi:hypothetical protein WIMU106979_24510 [Williamsia muralis]|uniref:peptidoglycan-binding domain-containing protein n=1 Tax=Williamsia marianensis TaxID=85044 RepID=UPI0039EAE4B9